MEVLADRISIVRKGKIVETGSLTDLRHLGRTTVTMTTTQPLADLAGWDGVDLHPEGKQTSLNVDTAQLPEVMRGHGATSTPSTPLPNS